MLRIRTPWKLLLLGSVLAALVGCQTGYVPSDGKPRQRNCAMTGSSCSHGYPLPPNFTEATGLAH